MNSANPVEVLPGLFQIALPIPIQSLGYVFAYFVFDGNQSVLIDTGWQGKESRNVLESALSSIGFSFSRLETIVVSHLHPDHFGLAEEIRKEAPKCKVIMHKEDAAWILNSKEEYERFVKELHEWLGLHGTPKEDLAAMYNASLEMLRFFTPPRPDVFASGGELIKVGERWKLELIHTPGHTIGNICLFDKGGSKAFFSGDHILPSITPNVSLSPRYNENPLGDYLDSLNSLKPLDTGVVLPSHENTFSNLRRRIIEIEEHHRVRLEEVIAILKDGPANAYKIAERVRWDSGSWESFGPWERRAALMETLAHLRYLTRRGKVSEGEANSGAYKLIFFSLLEK